MKFNVSRITNGVFAAGMLVGVSACVQLFDHGPEVTVRPVANMQGGKTSLDSEYYLSAVSAINSRDYATALEYLQAARAKEPENIRVLNAFGVVYDKLGRFDLSARYYAQAGALDPKSIIVAKNIAYSKALQGISAPDVSQLASAGTSPTETIRAADAQAAPVLREVALATPAPSLVSAPAGVTAAAQSSASEVPAGPSATMVAMAPPKPVVAIVPASLSLPRSATPAAAAIAKMAVPASFTSARPAYSSDALAVPIKAAASPKAGTSKKVLLTGYPLIVTDASGAMDTVQLVRHNLAMRGWTISRAAAPNVRSQHDSILFYPPANSAAAHALARTLPFPVRMTVNQCHCGGLQLMVGSNVPSWKNVRPHSPNSGPKALSVAVISNTSRMGVQ